MGTTQPDPTGPNLAQGIAPDDLRDGQMLAGRVGQEPVLLARCGQEFFAIGAVCSHYNGPLAEGLLVGDTVRCPWHHAAFSVRTGEAVRAPALSPVACWAIERRDGKVFVQGRKQSAPHDAASGAAPQGQAPDRIVIVGAGAAGFAAAELLRRERYAGRIVMLSHESAPPVDRPNLSKDYLAGSAPEDWIELRLNQPVDRIDLKSHAVVLASGEAIAFDRLLIATGAEPNRLTIPGSELP